MFFGDFFGTGGHTLSSARGDLSSSTKNESLYLMAMSEITYTAQAIVLIIRCIAFIKCMPFSLYY